MIIKISKLILCITIPSIFAKFLIDGMIKPPKNDFKKYKIRKELYGCGDYFITELNYEFFTFGDVVHYNGYFRICDLQVYFYCASSDKGYSWIPHDILKKLG
jgi:hypothetical protein